MPMMVPSAGAPGFRDRALYQPRSVVLLADPALPETAILARNLADGGFRGALHVVGMAAPGLVEVPDIASLPEAPDLAVLCLPPEGLEPAMAALAARGCFAAVVPVAAPDLAGISARTGVRALGQGSFGLCLPKIGLNASLAHIAPAPGRLALVTQSAALARAVLDWAAAESVGFSHVIGIGGNASLGFAGALDWLARDATTGAVLLDLRRIRNRRAFISAARAVARTRPVVAIRAGGRAGEATADAVMEGALRRAGVLRVAGLEELLAAAETLARVRPRPGAAIASARGDRVAIVTNGIGLGQLATDALLAGGGRLAEFPPAAALALGLHLPPGWQVGNPLSLGPGAGTRLAEAAAMVASLPEVDSVVLLHAPSPAEDGDAAAEALVAAVKAGARAAPILAGWVGEATAEAQRRRLSQAGLAVFETPEAAVRGALQLAQDRRNRALAAELPGRELLEAAPRQEVARRIIAAARAEGRLDLTHDEALELLAAHGVPVVPYRLARGPEEAAAAATLLGFPVVLKIRCQGLTTKSELGGVRLNLGSAAEVLREARAMQEDMACAGPGARLEGFMVQRQATARLELQLRLGEDAMFGPWIGFGAGGAMAALLEDDAFDLPPLNLALARQLVARSRVARLLNGFRGQPPADAGAVADALVRLSGIAVDCPEVASLTINPLFADAAGVAAADAVLRLRPPGEIGVLAIPPYPTEWVAPFTLRNGEVLQVRPIRPEDAAAHAEAFADMTAEDVRFRFFSPLKEMSPEMVARLTQIDYDREIAFIASRRRPDGTEQTLGVARLVREPGGDAGEFAVVVLPAMKGLGLGGYLMQRLAAWGKAQGMREMAGHVLADNAPMLRFMRGLGFSLRRSPDDDEVYEAKLAL